MAAREYAATYASAFVAVTLASAIGHIWSPSKLQGVSEAALSLLVSIPFGAFYGLILAVPMLLVGKVSRLIFQGWEPKPPIVWGLGLIVGGFLGVVAGHLLEGRIRDFRLATTYLISGISAGAVYLLIRKPLKQSH